MQVRVLAFGVLRDLLGPERVLNLPINTTVTEALAAANLFDSKNLLQSCAVAVNHEYVGRDHPLQEGDELALLPPVSGGADGRVALVRQPIVTADLLRGFACSQDGAVVTFEGLVRDNTGGRGALHLDYEAYEEMALRMMVELAATARRRYDLSDALIVHRLGRIVVGEVSVVVAAASPHRAQAFDGCRWLIDALKTTVPIWKREQFADGAVWADGEPFPQALVR